MVSWLGSLRHASEWVADQNLADPNTWNSSALQILKQLHDRLLTHYNCTEWAPPLVDTAPAPDAPAQGRDDDSARPLPFLRLTFTLFCVFGRMWTMAKLLLVRRYLHNVRSQSTSKRTCGCCMSSGCCVSRCCKIRLRIACVPSTCFTTPNRCPCLMRTLPCVATCLNATTRREASNHVSLSPMPRHYGARWAARGRQTAAMRRAPRGQ